MNTVKPVAPPDPGLAGQGLTPGVRERGHLQERHPSTGSNAESLSGQFVHREPWPAYQRHDD
jgi:hypothetical protein